MVLGCKVLQVINVLLRQHRDVHLDTRQVAVLALTQALAVEHSAAQLSARQDLIHTDAEGAICKQDLVAHMHALAQLLIAEADARLCVVLVALKAGVFGSHCLHNDALACYQINVLVVTQHGCADLRALGVKQGSPVGSSAQLALLLQLLSFGLGNLAEAVQHLKVPCMVPMRKVEADDVHAAIQQLAQHLLAPALRAHGADDLGPPGGCHRLGDERQAGQGGAQGTRAWPLNRHTRGKQQSIACAPGAPLHAATHPDNSYHRVCVSVSPLAAVSHNDLHAATGGRHSLGVLCHRQLSSLLRVNLQGVNLDTQLAKADVALPEHLVLSGQHHHRAGWPVLGNESG